MGAGRVIGEAGEACLAPTGDAPGGDLFFVVKQFEPIPFPFECKFCHTQSREEREVLLLVFGVAVYWWVAGRQAGNPDQGRFAAPPHHPTAGW